MNVNPNNQAEVDQWAKENDTTLNLIVAGVEIGLAILIIIIAAVIAKPYSPHDTRTTRRPSDDYDDYEDVPRRRRPVEDDADEDRARRREWDDRDR
jgi:hypothetical protein